MRLGDWKERARNDVDSSRRRSAGSGQSGPIAEPPRAGPTLWAFLFQARSYLARQFAMSSPKASLSPDKPLFLAELLLLCPLELKPGSIEARGSL